VRFSETLWAAPDRIAHRDGFLASVRSARNDGDLSPPFDGYIEQALNERLVSLDHQLGFYRDKFITHCRRTSSWSAVVNLWPSHSTSIISTVIDGR
jgi:hypothetical protein